MAKFGIDSNMVFDANGKSVAARLSDHDVSLDGLSSSLAESTSDIQSRGFNPKIPFGTSLTPLKGDGTDETTSIQAAYDYCKQNSIKDIIFPSGVFGISGNLLFTDGINIHGQYNAYSDNGIPSGTKSLKGTVFKDISTGNINPMIQVGSSSQFIAGFTMRNICFDSAYTERKALYLQRVGWSLHLENIFFNGFKGGAITFDCTYDGTVRGLDVANCGGKLSNGTTAYAVEFVNTTSNAWDVANALHVFGMHIEFCRYSLKLDKARHNQFIGSKIENIETTANTDTTNPYILITDQCSEITFDSCMFVMPSVTNYINTVQTNFSTSLTADQVPYYFKTVKNTSDLSTSWTPLQQCVKFSSCDFTTSGRGSKVMQANSKVLISNCFFDYLSGQCAYSLELYDGSRISNSHIYVHVGGTGYCNGIKLTDSDFSDTTIETAVDSGVTTFINSYPITTYGTSTVRGLKIKSVVWNYSILNADAIRTKVIEKNKSRQTINDALLTTLFGNVTFTSFVLDLNKVTSDFVALGLNETITITDITAQYDGQEIYLYNNSANVITINKGSNIHLANAANSITLAGSQYVRMKYLNFMWFAETPYVL
jgi:hypothetical protein